MPDLGCVCILSIGATALTGVLFYRKPGNSGDSTSVSAGASTTSAPDVAHNASTVPPPRMRPRMRPLMRLPLTLRMRLSQ